MNKNEFKRLVIEEAKKFLAENKTKNSTTEVVEKITPDHIKKLAEECKKITTSLDFRNPVINDEELIAESVEPKEQKLNESSRWKKLIEYRVFEDENFGEQGKPEDYYEFIIKHKGIPAEMLSEGILDKVSKAALPFILAGYLSIFGGNIDSAVAQFEKETKTKATPEVVAKGIEVATEKGVDVQKGNEDLSGKDQNGIKKHPLEGEELKQELMKQPAGPGHDPNDIKDWKAGNTPSYKTGTPSEVAKTKAENEAKEALKRGDDLGGKITWITPDGKTKIYVFHYDGNDKYYEIGRASIPQDMPSFEPKDIAPDTSKSEKDLTPVKSTETSLKGQKIPFSMNINVKSKKVPTGDGGYRIVKTGKPIGASFLFRYNDGTSYVKDPNGNYWDISDVNNPVKFDTSNPDIKAALDKMELDTPPKILFKTWLDAKPGLKDNLKF